MPIYEYICKNCNRTFEALVMGSQNAECPSCGGVDLEQKFSSYAVGAGVRGAQWSSPRCGTPGGT